MKATHKAKVFTLFSSLLLFIPILSMGAVFTAQIEGNWESPATWGEATLTPGAGDDVVIDGIKVYLSSSITINNLLITNANASGESSLELSTNNAFLIVTGDLEVFSENVNENVKLILLDESQILVNGDLTMKRSSDNNHSADLKLDLKDISVLTVNNNFTYDYKNSNGEATEEIKITDDASLIVKENAELRMENGGSEFTFFLHDNANVEFQKNLIVNQSGGDQFIFHVHGAGVNVSVGVSLLVNNSGGQNPLVFELQEGVLAIENDLSLVSTSDQQTILFELSSVDTELDVNGDIKIAANDNESAGISMTLGAKLYLGGNFVRNNTNKYGYLSMDNSSEFHFDGNSSQNIPKFKPLTSGSDSLAFSNIRFNNTSNEGITLTGDLLVTTEMTLTTGIINTSDTAYLIIDDGATISLGNSDAYINGPMKKRGNTGGNNFTFPVGNNRTYAAFTIDPITDSNLEYTVEYIGCPPPIGIQNAPVKNVNSSGYWEVSRSDGASVGNISLHWDDAADIGIDDLSSLIVVYYDPSTGWFSLDGTNETGGTGSGVSGSISNDIGCPPPIGIQTFAFGSTDENKNAPLPVEITFFKVYKNNLDTKSFIEWETSSEENTDYFAVEKSLDGIHFREIARISAAGNSTNKRYYSTEDSNPEKGSNYYRIKQVDLDGMMDFTRLAHVFINLQDEKPIIYPNPAKDFINLYSKDFKLNEEIQIKIFDIKGSCMYTGTQIAQFERIRLSTNITNIQESGIYYISYLHNGKIFSVEFLKTSD